MAEVFLSYMLEPVKGSNVYVDDVTSLEFYFSKHPDMEYLFVGTLEMWRSGEDGMIKIWNDGPGESDWGTTTSVTYEGGDAVKFVPNENFPTSGPIIFYARGNYHFTFTEWCYLCDTNSGRTIDYWYSDEKRIIEVISRDLAYFRRQSEFLESEEVIEIIAPTALRELLGFDLDVLTYIMLLDEISIYPLDGVDIYVSPGSYGVFMTPEMEDKLGDYGLPLKPFRFVRIYGQYNNGATDEYCWRSAEKVLFYYGGYLEPANVYSAGYLPVLYFEHCCVRGVRFSGNIAISGGSDFSRCIFVSTFMGFNTDLNTGLYWNFDGCGLETQSKWEIKACSGVVINYYAYNYMKFANKVGYFKLYCYTSTDPINALDRTNMETNVEYGTETGSYLYCDEKLWDINYPGGEATTTLHSAEVVNTINLGNRNYPGAFFKFQRWRYDAGIRGFFKTASVGEAGLGTKLYLGSPKEHSEEHRISEWSPTDATAGFYNKDNYSQWAFVQLIGEQRDIVFYRHGVTHSDDYYRRPIKNVSFIEDPNNYYDDSLAGLADINVTEQVKDGTEYARTWIMDIEPHEIVVELLKAQVVCHEGWHVFVHCDFINKGDFETVFAEGRYLNETGELDLDTEPYYIAVGGRYNIFYNYNYFMSRNKYIMMPSLGEYNNYSGTGYPFFPLENNKFWVSPGEEIWRSISRSYNPDDDKWSWIDDADYKDPVFLGYFPTDEDYINTAEEEALAPGGYLDYGALEPVDLEEDYEIFEDPEGDLEPRLTLPFNHKEVIGIYDGDLVFADVGGGLLDYDKVVITTEIAMPGIDILDVICNWDKARYSYARTSAAELTGLERDESSTVTKTSKVYKGDGEFGEWIYDEVLSTTTLPNFKLVIAGGTTLEGTFEGYIFMTIKFYTGEELGATYYLVKQPVYRIVCPYLRQNTTVPSLFTLNLPCDDSGMTFPTNVNIYSEDGIISGIFMNENNRKKFEHYRKYECEFSKREHLPNLDKEESITISGIKFRDSKDMSIVLDSCFSFATNKSYHNARRVGAKKQGPYLLVSGAGPSYDFDYLMPDTAHWDTDTQNVVLLVRSDSIFASNPWYEVEFEYNPTSIEGFPEGLRIDTNSKPFIASKHVEGREIELRIDSKLYIREIKFDPLYDIIDESDYSRRDFHKVMTGLRRQVGSLVYLRWGTIDWYYYDYYKWLRCILEDVQLKYQTGRDIRYSSVIITLRVEKVNESLGL